MGKCGVRSTRRLPIKKPWILATEHQKKNPEKDATGTTKYFVLDHIIDDKLRKLIQ